jgi:membrane-associated protease RseP (regulator of RpoE activity)
MTDEPTGDDTTEAGDAPTGTGDDDNTEAQPAVESDPTPAAKGADGERAGVFIPRGVAILLGVLLIVGLVGGGGFALGRSTADDDHGGDHRAFVPFRPDGRTGPQSRNGNGGNNDDNNSPGNGGSQLPFPTQPSPSGGAFLGVQIDNATSDTTGAQVVRVTSDSPADRAGLEAGDVVTKVDGDEIANAEALFTAISGHASGDKVTITYVRNGDTKTADVTLGDRPSSNSNSAPAVPS